MSETPTAAPSTDNASGVESWTALAAWAADELGVRLEFDGTVYRIEDAGPAEPSDASASESTIRRGWFRRRPKPETEDAAEPEPEPFTADAPADVVEELVRRLNDAGEPIHARPIEQPTAVHELSARLFDAYKLDAGQAHLAGCHFEDVPLVRLTWLADSEEATPRIEHRFFDELGVPLAWTEAVALGVDRIAPMADPIPRVEAGRLERMLTSATKSAASDPPALATLVWAKRAWGRLRFEFGDESLDTEFEGWARTLEAPPAVCPATGTETFHLAATDDGRIAAAESITPSVVTGRRALASELVACSATGLLAEAEHFAPCAATAEPVLLTELASCNRCGLSVGTREKHAGDCNACRAAEPVALDEATWGKAVAAHPKLAARKWQATQTADAYVLESSGWFRRNVVTLDRQSLAVLHAAEASRFSSTWRPVAAASYQ